MSATTNTEVLIDTLMAGGELDGRYAIIRCVNYPPPSGMAKRGHFST